LTGWNGMMISALAIGARVLNDANYLQAAQRAAAFILNKMRRPDGRLLARYRDGQALYPAYALDYACMVWAMLEIYQSCFDSSYLEIAQELNQQVIEYFWDHDQGGVFFYGQDAESLLTRPKEVYDGAIPSSNSLCIMNFLRLGRISGDITLENKAEQALKLFYGRVKEQPVAYTFFLSAALNYFHPGQEIVIVGDRKDPDSRAFLDKINHSYLPRTLVLFKEDEQTAFLEGIPYVQEMKKINDLLQVTVSTLIQRNKTIAVAESCTGGLLGKILTDLPGSSAYFWGGVISYSNEAKQRLLGVSQDLLENFGAVSRECAEAMVRGLVHRSGTDLGVAITGIAGPSGGSEEKPVGLVYIAVLYRDSCTIKEVRLGGQRDMIRMLAAKSALDTVRRILMDEER
jgi:PncC family amidohydrolase